MHEFDECDFNQMSIFSRIPYSSLSAFLLCLSGITLFFLMIFWSFNSSIEQFRRTFNVMDISWLDKVFFDMVFLQFSQFLCISGGYRVFFGKENRYKNFSFTKPLPVSMVLYLYLFAGESAFHYCSNNDGHNWINSTFACST